MMKIICSSRKHLLALFVKLLYQASSLGITAWIFLCFIEVGENVFMEEVALLLVEYLSSFQFFHSCLPLFPTTLYKLLLLFSRYWNDKDVLQKLGEAMGHAVGGEAATSTDISGLDETDEPGNEDESIVHQTASIGDAEVLSISYLFLYYHQVFDEYLNLPTLCNQVAVALSYEGYTQFQ